MFILKQRDGIISGDFEPVLLRDTESVSRGRKEQNRPPRDDTPFFPRYLDTIIAE
jgi:hypothetical protein